MLGKLLKYEFKASSRILIPLYLILLITTGINRLILQIDIFDGPLIVIPVLMKTLFTLSVITILIATFLLMIYRFYKNLLSDEGYLMFTLPTKTYQLIISKYLATLLWGIVSVIIIAGSIALAFGTPDNIKLFINNVKEYFVQLEITTGESAVVAIIALILFCFMTLTVYIFLIYTAIAIGQLFTKNKLIGAFVSYIGINTIMQILILLVLVLTNSFKFIAASNTNMIPVKIILSIIVFQFIASIVFFIITNRIFQKKLNLE